MMKYEDYEKLWGKISQFKKRLKKPSYYEYLQREIYFQDYLDLFLQNDIDSITYKRKEINGFQTVLIDGFILEPTEKFTITDHETGLTRLIVDHKYPFENEVFGRVKNIKYILIGEAAPGGNKNISKVNSQQIGGAAPEGGKKYIYKDANSAYMTAPLRASGIDPDKLKSFKRLEKFAEKGYLLLDLIPFAIDFTKHADLRLQISSNQQLMYCFIEALEDRVSRLANDGFLNPEWDFCFVGPETTSVGIMEFIEKEKKGLFIGKTLGHCDDKMDADDFTYQVTRKDKKTGMTITATQIKTNYTTHPTPGGEISHISKRARLTTIIGGSGPHSELIQRAFGL